MNTKIKNDSSRYISRASLGGIRTAHRGVRSISEQSPINEAEQEQKFRQREMDSVIDDRWYIQFPARNS